MINDKNQLLNDYIKANVGPILIESFSLNDNLSSILIPADISFEDFYAKYDESNYIAPKWFLELVSNNYKMIVIDGIDKIKLEDQRKFIELLKYRKISVFNIPDDCAIVVTATNISDKTISSEIFSLCVCIR